jgi:peptidoglycan lytic transglycosylase
MHERAGTRSGNFIPLKLFALVAIAGAVFLKTAPHIGPFTSAPKSDNPAIIAEATSEKPSARLVARAELQNTKPKSAMARAWVQPGNAAPPTEGTTEVEPRSKIVITAQALPLPQPGPKLGSAMLRFTAPPLPVAAPKQTRSAKSDAPPLPKRAPKEVQTKSAGSALQQTGRASWYSLDSPTANGEKMDDAALTAAHNFLPFGTKVLIENVANGHSVVVRINDRGPFVAGRIIDLSKAAAEALDLIPAGVTDVHLSVIYQTEVLKSRAGGSLDEKALAPTRTALVDPQSKPVRRNSQAAKVDLQSKSAKHQKRPVTEIGTPATSTVRTASVDTESKPIRRNTQAAKVDPESKSVKPKKRAVSKTGTPAASARAPVVKHQPGGLFGGMKLADGRESVFRGFLKSAFGNP